MFTEHIYQAPRLFRGKIYDDDRDDFDDMMTMMMVSVMRVVKRLAVTSMMGISERLEVCTCG